MREQFDGAVAFSAAMGILSIALVAWRVRRPFILRSTRLGELAQLAAVVAASAAIALLISRHVPAIAGIAAISVAAVISLRLALPRLTMAGAIELASGPAALFAFLPWSYWFLVESGFPPWFMALWWAGLPLIVPGLAYSWACKLAQQALFTHRRWGNPVRPLPARGAGPFPKVSLHVPCYSEPPDVVIATLDGLAALRYPDYEVIVCDNNTPDRALWEPVRRHCEQLNESLGIERFRFFHVSPLAGAKAGALNFCLRHTAPDAKLVGVLDADYLARPDFLARLAGYFDDGRIGFVQTSHDYRDFKASRYLRASYHEYMPAYKVDMPGLQEYGAPFTIGTMCLFPKSVLEECGQWAEWCLTEDSEISIRIRALGYRGIYLRDTFGRGLIPEKFEHFKKQRFRWAAGPVQQLRRYWRWFLPKALGGHPKLDGWSKLLEFDRAFDCMMWGPSAVLAVIGIPIALSFMVVGLLPVIHIPTVGWYAMGLGMGKLLLTRWKSHRLSGCARISDMIRGEVARVSLFYVKATASFGGLSRRPQAWNRTPKFRAEAAGFESLASALPETMIGIAFLLLAAWLPTLHTRIGWDLALLTTLGALAASFTFFSATWMAWACERELVRLRGSMDESSVAAVPGESVLASTL